MMRVYESWGRFPKARQESCSIKSRRDNLPEIPEGKTLLPHGLGRSYGDCCLNDDGFLLDTANLDHFIAFDREQGILRCEAGVSLAAILDLIVPQGWFLPVVPGTRFVTLGGAIANDIHGKNHHKAGTFGTHVTQLELLRSDSRRLLCSPRENRDYFNATIAGLGLTGLIVWAEIRLKKISGPLIDCEILPFTSLEQFLEISESSDRDDEYTVAWIDALGRGKSFGRGVFFRGNHSNEKAASDRRRGRSITVPFDMPGFLLNRWSIRSFNELYYRHHKFHQGVKAVHYEPFFFPLDSLIHWNRLYGKDGFFQYQCVIPGRDGLAGIQKLLKAIAGSNLGSFLAVLKRFGDKPSPGMLSFPREGLTLSVDIKHTGNRSMALLRKLDQLVLQLGGAVYPAKDACMLPELYRAAFPAVTRFQEFRDSRLSSSLWQRLVPSQGIQSRAGFRRNEQEVIE